MFNADKKSRLSITTTSHVYTANKRRQMDVALTATVQYLSRRLIILTTIGM